MGRGVAWTGASARGGRGSGRGVVGAALRSPEGDALDGRLAPRGWRRARPSVVSALRRRGSRSTPLSAALNGFRAAYGLGGRWLGRHGFGRGAGGGAGAGAGVVAQGRGVTGPGSGGLPALVGGIARTHIPKKRGDVLPWRNKREVGGGELRETRAG